MDHNHEASFLILSQMLLLVSSNKVPATKGTANMATNRYPNGHSKDILPCNAAAPWNPGRIQVNHSRDMEMRTQPHVRLDTLITAILQFVHPSTACR